MNQKEALDILKLGHNAYITGPAGSGKTYLLNEYIRYLKSKGVGVAVTASTGIAATHMNGVTIHSWSGLGIKESLKKEDLRNLLIKPYLRKRFKATRVLIIDEVSMLHPWQFDLIDQICQAFKKNTKPFGGMQVVCSGDFFQLPPIQQDNSEDTQFVIAANAWSAMDMHICYLKEQHRHADDQLVQLLKEIRDGKVTKKTLTILENLKARENKMSIKPTKLYTHNADVDSINNREIQKIQNPAMVYRMHTSGKGKVVDFLKKSCLSPEKLVLKKGAVVMFVKNNYDQGYVNGTLGKIADFDENKLPIVKTLDGKTIIVTPAEWTIEEEDRRIALLKQLPLRLAWSITVHKSQGMSLDAAEIDLSKAFIQGMGYVALSRLRTLDNLNLLGFNETALEVSSDVKEIDKDLRIQSQTAQKYVTSLRMLRKKVLQSQFIQKSR